MKTVHNEASGQQGQEITTTELPERVLLREILEALDLPRPAHYDDRDVRRDLLEGRVAFILGYVGSALDSGDVAPSASSLLSAVTEYHPVAYKVYGGES